MDISQVLEEALFFEFDREARDLLDEHQSLLESRNPDTANLVINLCRLDSAEFALLELLLRWYESVPPLPEIRPVRVHRLHAAAGIFTAVCSGTVTCDWATALSRITAFKDIEPQHVVLVTGDIAKLDAVWRSWQKTNGPEATGEAIAQDIEAIRRTYWGEVSISSVALANGFHVYQTALWRLRTRLYLGGDEDALKKELRLVRSAFETYA